MSLEQFKRLKTIVIKHEPVVPFEKRTKMTQKQQSNEKATHEAIDKLGLIYDSVAEVKEENLRSEGLSE